MAIQDRIFGKPLATSEERAEQIGVGAGIPIFGLDALTSAAYGPEAALALLIPLGMLGTQYLLPIVTSILILLVIVYFSYRQTIAAYPSGGGSYTVATENLGERAGLLAAAALMIDYILTAAVGISAGVTADDLCAAQAFSRTPWRLCLLILAILAVVNLRGVKDTGTAFIVPTFLFIGTLLTLIAVGVYKTFAAGGHPLPVTEMPGVAADGAVSGPLDVAEGVLQRLRRHDRRRGGFQRRDGVPRARARRTRSMRSPSSSAS
jgi:amino acid transporter